MRMDEFSDGRYIKETDTIERYLLKLIQDYFNGTSVADESSRESIIQKAVKRMHEELTLDAIGVLSITLPDGAKRTGAVNISLAELGGEPAISEKKSAFNVSFGNTIGTACEGNDDRLSDRRIPKEHTHQISDVAGLEGELSTLQGKILRLNGIAHEHSNKDVLDKIIYTGEKKEIDLSALGGAESKVKEIAEKVEQDIINYKSEVSNKVNELNTKLDDNNTAIQEMRNQITEDNVATLAQANAYTDTVFSNSQTNILNEMDNTYVRKDSVGTLADIAKNAMTLAGVMAISIDTVINRYEINRTQVSEVNIDSTLLNELSLRGTTLKASQIEMLIKYYDLSGNAVYAPMPYIVFRNNTVDGTIQGCIIHSTNKVRISYISSSGIFPEELDAEIIINVYAKHNTTL